MSSRVSVSIAGSPISKPSSERPLHGASTKTPDTDHYSSSLRWSQTPEPLTFRELGELGYRFIVIGLGAAHAGLYGEWSYLRDLKNDEERAHWALEQQLAGHPTESHHALAGWEHYQALAARFQPPTGRNE